MASNRSDEVSVCRSTCARHCAWALSGRRISGPGSVSLHHGRRPSSTGRSGMSTGSKKNPKSARYRERGPKASRSPGYRLQDTTGAMAAFDWQRPAKSTPSQAGAAGGRHRVKDLLVVHGNYLLLFNGHKPEAADSKRNVRQACATWTPPCFRPCRPTCHPRDLVANSQRYITGPASLAKFVPGIPPSVAAFHYGAEGQLGTFHGPKGDMGHGDFQLPNPADCHAQGGRLQGNTRWQYC